MAKGVIMSKKYDLIGKQFGKLLVLEKAYVNNRIKWRCKCSCGNDTCYFCSDELNSGRKTMCGTCGAKLSHIKHRKSRIGEKHGRLTIVDEDYNYNGTGKKVFICNCDCGKSNIIKSKSYIWNDNSSCGCFTKESRAIKVGRNINNQRFGRLIVLETFWDTSPLKIRCKCDCGNIVILNKNDVQSGHTKSCGCLQRDRASESHRVDSTGYISSSGVKIIQPYKKNKKGQMLWECECGFCKNHFYDLPARIKNSHTQSCECVKMSIREVWVENFLKDNNINYKTQYSFADCKNKYVLHFDFAIFNKYNMLIALLEIDGEQHYKPIDYFGGDEGFALTHQRDEIKNKYCKDNNINLIRLPYYLSDNDIKEKILNIKLA